MNQDIIQAQKSVLAKPISAEFGLSRTGNDQVAIQFELLEGEDKGRQITAYQRTKTPPFEAPVHEI